MTGERQAGNAVAEVVRALAEPRGSTAWVRYTAAANTLQVAEGYPDLLLAATLGLASDEGGFDAEQRPNYMSELGTGGCL